MHIITSTGIIRYNICVLCKFTVPLYISTSERFIKLNASPSSLPFCVCLHLLNHHVELSPPSWHGQELHTMLRNGITHRLTPLFPYLQCLKEVKLQHSPPLSPLHRIYVCALTDKPLFWGESSFHTII